MAVGIEGKDDWKTHYKKTIRSGDRIYILFERELENSDKFVSFH